MTIAVMSPERFDALALEAVNALVHDEHAEANRGWWLARRVLVACGPPLGYGRTSDENGAENVAVFRERMVAHAGSIKVDGLIPSEQNLGKMRAAAALIPRDSRAESWKLIGDRSPDAHPLINFRITQQETVTTGRRADLLAPFVVESIKEANDRRLSLAVLHPPTRPELDFIHNPNSPDSPQLRLFPLTNQPLEHGSKRFAFNPYLRFEDERGEHRLQLRDWGVYEFLRKQGDAGRWELKAALHLSDESSLFVGNFHNHRNAWCVISVLSQIRRPAPLFDLQEEIA